MLDSGSGETKINTILSAANIPTVQASSLKSWERYVGQAIKELADETCCEAIAEEKQLTLEAKRYKYA